MGKLSDVIQHTQEKQGVNSDYSPSPRWCQNHGYCGFQIAKHDFGIPSFVFLEPTFSFLLAPFFGGSFLAGSSIIIYLSLRGANGWEVQTACPAHIFILSRHGPLSAAAFFVVNGSLLVGRGVVIFCQGLPNVIQWRPAG